MNGRKFDLVVGRNPVEEHLRHAADRVLKVYCNLDKNSPFFNELSQRLKQLKIPLQFIDKTSLDRISQGARHQGLAAEVEPKPVKKLKEFSRSLEAKAQSLLLMADNISDPHNLGAIIRAAECFGADGLIYSPNRGCDLTPVVYKSSAGAVEHLEIIRENNLHQALLEAKKLGYWVIGCDCGPESNSIFEFKFPDKSLIIMGSEGDGLQRLLKENCDHLIRIPMFGKVDSLNVSQAASVFCSFYKLSRR